ncbi:hypothetical protein J2S11_002034 [Bacillus horti]|uniref:Uncharacterized protein n=1 Tax=Caldalkalibacillus horti TaxID=77523 RepID=A0ABT9VYR2_9BACI|nr:hypothetical protein [Bacillus horti]
MTKRKPKENKLLMRFQRNGKFTTIRKSYEGAGIKLINISNSELKKIKTQDQLTIQKILNLKLQKPYEISILYKTLLLKLNICPLKSIYSIIKVIIKSKHGGNHV